MKFFISYRRGPGGDAPTARQLHEALARRFGSENVFFDTADVSYGEDFVKVIRSRVVASDVLVAVIGPNWMTILDEKDHRRLLTMEEDWVRVEIESALKRRPPVHIVPVLVEGAAPPDWRELPRTMKPLATQNARTLHHDQWDDDVKTFIDHLADEGPAMVEKLAAEERDRRRARAQRSPRTEQSEARYSPPDDEHFAEIAERITDGAVVTFLGPGVNASDREDSWHENGESLPAGDELARYLAAKVGLDFHDATRLAEVSEYALVAQDDHYLYRSLKEVLEPPRPTSVHRFLADLPRRLEELGSDHPYQVIVTSNYDDALEQAFNDVREDFHLAVYMARGAGKFVHVPHDRHDGTLVMTPNTYSGFRIDDEGAVRHRSVIVKIHGGLTNPPIQGDDLGQPGDPAASYVVTEDNHIAFLSQAPATAVIPGQILAKLTMSRRLFLGYPISDWSTRVLLHRLWSGQKPQRGWAIDGEPRTDRERRFDRDLWSEFRIELHSMRLDDYARRIDEALGE